MQEPVYEFIYEWDKIIKMIWSNPDLNVFVINCRQPEERKSGHMMHDHLLTPRGLSCDETLQIISKATQNETDLL